MLYHREKLNKNGRLQVLILQPAILCTGISDFGISGSGVVGRLGFTAGKAGDVEIVIYFGVIGLGF